MDDTGTAPIPQRRLGPDGVLVGAVGLGCMGMSWAYSPAERDDDESVAVIRAALDRGVTLLDTADAYGPFTNEELVGRAVAGRRQEAVLATKCGLVAGTHPATLAMHRDGRPEHVRQAIDGSLRRLGTGAVDLYQLHRVDGDVPLEETWGAMAEVAAAGKARAIGLSEVSVDELDRAAAVHPVATVQSELSLWTRGQLADVVPWCEEHGATFLAFSPLGRGFLTGTVGTTFEPDDFRARNPRFAPDAMAANQAIVDRVRTVAARHGATPAQVALAWILAQGSHVVPIPGTKKRRWLEDNAQAARLVLTEDDAAELDDVPEAVGTRY